MMPTNCPLFRDDPLRELLEQLKRCKLKFYGFYKPLNLIKISSHLRYKIAFFCVLQDLRTKEYREKTSQYFTMLYKSVIKFKLKYENIDIKESEIKVDFSKDQKKLMHLKNLADFEFIHKLSEYLCAKKWFIGVNQTKEPFFTSDNPLIKKAHDDSILGGIGYISHKTEFAIPLSSKYILIMLCPIQLKNLTNLTHKNCLVQDLDENNVSYYNHLQVALSYNYIFSETNKFEMMDKYLKATPEAADPFRKRVTSSWNNPE